MAKKKIKIDLNAIDDFAYVLQKNKDSLMAGVRHVAEIWGEQTRSHYDSISGHATIKGKKSFYRVEKKEKHFMLLWGMKVI